VKNLSELVKSTKKNDKSRFLVCVAFGVSICWGFIERFGLNCAFLVTKTLSNETALDAVFVAACFGFSFTWIAVIAAQSCNKLIDFFSNKNRSIS
jgi:hypothetical protein